MQMQTNKSLLDFLPNVYSRLRNVKKRKKKTSLYNKSFDMYISHFIFGKQNNFVLYIMTAHSKVAFWRVGIRIPTNVEHKQLLQIWVGFGFWCF